MKYVGIFSLIAFVISRLPFLGLPLFWDELGVYGASIFYMLDNGVSPHPAALPAWLSRGHPMLYVWANSLWASLFGSQVNVTVLHSFNLLIGTAVATSVWKIGSSLRGPKYGLLAMLFLLVQPIFRTQSNLVLPEVSLALTALWMVYAFHAKKWWLYFIAGVAAIWIKETAVVIPATLVFASVLLTSLEHTKLRISIREILLTSSPYLGFLLFLQLNYTTHGWYFFPYHTDGFNFSPGSMLYMFSHYLDFLFWEQGRFLLPLILLVFLGTRFSKGIGDIYNLVLGNRFEITATVVILGLLVFSSSTYYMNRYTLLLLPLLSLLFARLLLYVHDRVEGNLKKAWTTFLVSILLAPILAGIVLSKQGFAYGENDGYRAQVLQLKKAVSVAERATPPGAPVFSNFPLQLAMKDHRYGYLDREAHLNVLDAPDSSCYIFIVHPGDPSHGIPILDSTRYHWIHLDMDPIIALPLK